MTAEEWERIKSIFEAALEIEADARSAFLDSACSGRADLRSVVDKLLAQYEDADRFLDDAKPTLHRPVFVRNQLVAGRFRVVRLIASGGMGEVYEVFDERLRVRVALKTIRTDLGASREAYERFKREVWVTREVPHEGICRVFELIEHIDPDFPDRPVIPCLTMKFLDGHTLQAEIKERRPLPLGEALALLRGICAALQVLHDHGIIHRDLKPSNIMLVRNGDVVTPVLTDFGLARPLGQSSVTAANADHQPGAPYFMAPEILKGERESIASDIYALGLVADEMVTSSRAFTAESIHALYYQKLWEKPLPPARRAKDLPAQWQHVILRCLAANPEERYSRVSDLIADLDSVNIPSRSGPRLRSFQWTKPKRRTVLAGAIVPVLLLVMLLPMLVWSEAPVSVLVSPVVNQTGNKEIDTLASGATMELLRRLSRVDGVQVFQFPKAGAGDSQLHKKTRYSFEANLQQHEGLIRLAARLAENESGNIVWTAASEKSMNEALSLEREITDGLVTTLEGHVSSGAGRFLSPARRVVDPVFRSWFPSRVSVPRSATTSVTAFQNYMRAQMLLEDRSPKSADAAFKLLQTAVEVDPNFALAFTAMADVARLRMEHGAKNQAVLLTEAREYAERAVLIDPNLPEAHSTLAAVMQVEWQWDRADESYRKALEIHPRFARARRQYAGLLLQFGRFDEALKMTREAMDIDPLDYPTQSFYGFALFHSGHYREAAEHLERVLAEKDLLPAHVVLGQVYAMLAGASKPAESQIYADKAFQQAAIIEQVERKDGSPGGPILKWSALINVLTQAYRGHPAEARVWLDRMEQWLSADRISSYSVASAHAALKNYDRALDLLKDAAAYREKELTHLKITPYFAPIRNDPRFRRLLAVMRLPTT